MQTKLALATIIALSYLLKRTLPLLKKLAQTNITNIVDTKKKLNNNIKIQKEQNELITVKYQQAILDNENWQANSQFLLQKKLNELRKTHNYEIEKIKNKHNIATQEKEEIAYEQNLDTIFQALTQQLNQQKLEYKTFLKNIKL